MSEQMINLESKPLENHFQELYSLVKNTILFTSISAIGWSVVAPQLLADWVNLFNIGDNINQLSIYTPFKLDRGQMVLFHNDGYNHSFPTFLSNAIRVL